MTWSAMVVGRTLVPVPSDQGLSSAPTRGRPRPGSAPGLVAGGIVTFVLSDGDAFLRAEPGIEVVAEASDGAEAVAAVAAHDPDVALMDVRMPGTDGIEATRLITAAAGRTTVLVLTTFDQDDVVFRALRAGASGFLLKDAPEERLIPALHWSPRADPCSRRR